MTSWHSYPKIYNLGHAALKDLLDGTILIEEKVDGSQFSFGRFGNDLRVRSKGVEMRIEAPENMFSKAVDWVKANADKLVDGCTYRAEYLQKPKHNTLAYDRAPENNLIIFDINFAEEAYSHPLMKFEYAKALGLEVVPSLYFGEGKDFNIEQLTTMLERVSILGGAKIEGVVIKNYSKFGPDKKVLMGKHVSEQFKEMHSGDWKERNPTSGDVMSLLAEKYRSPARWAKAVQHLKEAGLLTDSPKDIGALMNEVKRDVSEECAEEIKEQLFKFALPRVIRSVANGLPEWYKNQLLAKQFDASGSAIDANTTTITN